MSAGKTVLFMPRRALLVAFFFGCMVALGFYPWYSEVSLWIGVGILLFVVILTDLVNSNRFLLPYPQIAGLIALVQLVLAAWGSWYFPSETSTLAIGGRLPIYLEYAGPLCLIFSISILLPMFFRFPATYARHESVSPEASWRLRKELNTLFWIGVSAGLLGNYVPGGLRFVFVLVEYLVFVAAFGYVVFGFPGWAKRLGGAMALEAVKGISAGSFHELIIWSASTVMFLAWARSWSRRRIVVLIALGFVAIFSIDAIKGGYRQQYWYGGVTRYSSPLIAFPAMFLDAVLSPQTLVAEDRLGSLFGRMNQGGIVNTAMIWTPKYEPFAYGRTIVRDMTVGMVPRALSSGKGVVSGREDYERYTGRTLFGGTSMALGYAGEMYVNFGVTGGLVGVGIYALLLGAGYRWFAIRAARHPLWWALVPYFASVAIKAETSIGVLVSWLVKGAVIMAVVLWRFPVLRYYLRDRPPEKPKAAAGIVRRPISPR